MKWGEAEQGWKSIFSFLDVEVTRGSMGSLDVVLADNSPPETEETDLLINFDDCEKARLSISGRNYQLQEANVFPSREVRKFGSCAAGFYHGNSLKIKPLEGSVFRAEGSIKSFSVDFYIFPDMISDSTVVFAWYAPDMAAGGAFSGLKAYFDNGRLFWLFENVFRNKHGVPVSVRIGESAATPLKEWRHHALHYDSSNGLLTIYFDGKESSFVWLTESGIAGSTLLRGQFSTHLDLPMVLGESFFGYIDEFRISRGNPLFYLGNYRNAGEIRSEVFSLESLGTEIVKAVWDSSEENGTAVRVYIRVSDTYFLPSEDPEKQSSRKTAAPAWVPVKNGASLSGIFPPARYFQWKAELFGTGIRSPTFIGTGSTYTPSLRSLTLLLEPDDPPLAPVLLKAVPVNGGIKLFWLKNKESDIRGYKVYFGPSSKYYFGKNSARGDSPVFVGNVDSFELTGLKNEEVYFLSITAVDSSSQESAFSRELIARPSAVYREE